MHDFMDVLAFHQRFNLPLSQFQKTMEMNVFQFRSIFLLEEIKEYDTAYQSGNLIKVTDALLDFVYVSIGTALFLGAPRSGYQGIWPTFPTARRAIIQHAIFEDEVCPPTLLPAAIHSATKESMSFHVSLFIHLQTAAERGEPGALEWQLVALKNAADEAYKAAAMMCIPWEECWRHVQDANMKKKRAKGDGSDSKRFSSFDVVKPVGWISPDVKIAHELMSKGWRLPERFQLNCNRGTIEEVHA